MASSPWPAAGAPGILGLGGCTYGDAPSGASREETHATDGDRIRPPGGWRRMVREFEAMGSFSGLTTVLLGAAYAAHAGWAVRGLVRAPATLPLPARTARAAGAAAGLSGSALALSGMARFESVAQLWGAEVDGLVSGGPYRSIAIDGTKMGAEAALDANRCAAWWRSLTRPAQTWWSGFQGHAHHWSAIDV